MASSFSLRSFAVTLLIFSIVLSPLVVLPCSSARALAGRELLVPLKRPICPACMCCEPPPPGSCCRCANCSGDLQAEVQKTTP